MIATPFFPRMFVFCLAAFWPVMIFLLQTGLIKMGANDIGYFITGWVIAFMLLFIGTSITTGYEE